MKTEFRRDLAQLSFEEKIRKVGELILLSRKVKGQRVRGTVESYPQQSSNQPPKNSKK
jgi:hypothetical protein